MRARGNRISPVNQQAAPDHDEEEREVDPVHPADSRWRLFRETNGGLGSPDRLWNVGLDRRRLGSVVAHIRSSLSLRKTKPNIRRSSLKSFGAACSQWADEKALELISGNSSTGNTQESGSLGSIASTTSSQAPSRSVRMFSGAILQATAPSAAIFTNGLLPQMNMIFGGAGRRCRTSATIASSIRRPKSPVRLGVSLVSARTSLNPLGRRSISSNSSR